MRVRTTIFLLLLLAGTAFVAGLYQVRRNETEKFEIAATSLRRAWADSVHRFWENRGGQLQTLVQELPKREGVVAAILDNNRQWAAANWSAQVLSGFEASALWAYRRDGTLFYSRAVTQRADLEPSPLSPEAVSKLYGADRDPSPVFYFALPSSSPNHLRFVEVRGTPVWQVWDKNKQAPAEGYFLAGRIWDDDELRQLLLPENTEASFLPAGQALVSPFSRSSMQEAILLRDWQGKEIGRLVFTTENPQLKELDIRGDRIFRTLLVGALGLFLILLILLDRAVVRPLRRVIQSLHTENLSLLAPLRGQKAEFGQLARLIDLFFAQRADLVHEKQALHESEEKLRHSQKMEAVGRLAGGVAHDFNNLLTAIIGYADVLRQRSAENPAISRPAELIHQAGEQAAGLTRQLLAFSRKQLLQPKIIDLNTIILNLHRLLQRIIGEHIEIVAQTCAEPACVKADPGQIEQVIVNLGVNARDAMPRGGRLTIRTVHLTLAAGHDVPDLEAGAYVALEVVDTGEGMDSETKARIFEPFFTTKGPGKGTGLGLATVYGIIKQSHGGIAVESERGQGSTFRIYLPREEGPIEVTVPVAPSAKTAGRQESILVVEDEDIVRDLVCEILREHGYRVLQTDRGSEALRLVREEAKGIDLLISDVVMPEMNGALVAQGIHEICPRARVLFVSGYSETDMADQGLELLAYQVLQKPFTPETLARKVREILDGAPANGASEVRAPV